jgi:adenylosuccinate lyase
MSDVLADRYASKEMREIWSREFKIKAERRLWITVLETQASLGFDVSPKVIEDYKKKIGDINLASIDAREKVTKHDVKARIDEFNALTGHQKIHMGMTSRDLTENIELFQLSASLELTQLKAAALLKHLAEFAREYLEVPIVARTHNVPAQLTTLGRRAATWMEELIYSFSHLEDILRRLPLRGIKGPIGTSQDFVDLFGDSSQKVENSVATELGFNQLLIAPSQIYPRSIDYEIVTALVQLAGSPSNIATNIRIMSGFGLVSEGFAKDQVGSSAMPHKINARLSERVNGLIVVLKGNVVMVQELVGNQWNEGDVSCSVVRRVALPDAFYAMDAILDTTMRIIRELDVQTNLIAKEVNDYLPFLVTTKLLSKAVQNGMGREDAHALLKKLSISANENLKQYGRNNLFELVSSEAALGMTTEFLNSVQEPSNLTRNAIHQAQQVIEKAQGILEKFPDSLTYKPIDSI